MTSCKLLLVVQKWPTSPLIVSILLLFFVSVLICRNLVEIRGHRTLENQASRLCCSHSARQNDRGRRLRYGSCIIIYLSTTQLLSRLVWSKHLLSSYRQSAISAGHRRSLPSRKKKMGEAVTHVDATLLCRQHCDPWSPAGSRRCQSSTKLRPWDSICKRGGDSLTIELWVYTSENVAFNDQVKH